ncbi:GDP-L-fucose synthase [Treponema sp. TIM-1]|uniref:GDP-L-fucose synthase family protein n=1 Tax=Treponema sp. TIM-1 TaxID=2898417 RepID=UPI0039803EA8
MKIFISGSNGMVGRNLLENEDITKHDILKPPSSELNLLNFNDIKIYLKKTKPDMIIHCAGKVGGIQANMKDMYKFFTENALMGINLVKAAKEHGIKKFLNLSSSCTYPRNYKNPLKEEYILQAELEPTNEGYALAKLSILKMCEYISREYPGYQYKTFIPCNLYGRWDKFDEANSHMIPAVIKKIYNAVVSKLPEIEIWGDGTARREFMYASDLASCVAKAIENFEDVPSVMNVGLGFDYSINEYYETIKKILEYKGSFIYNTSMPVGMKQKLLNIDLQSKWGWKPQVSLEQGIERTYQFFLGYVNDKV